MFRDFHIHFRPGARAQVRSKPTPPARRTETARPGIRCNSRQMQPAALRVLETTWRVWREPLA
jgi:hypothetical protein